jgi:sugar lactone lactonase YvrE
MRAELLHPTAGVLCEGPLARRNGTLAWVDIQRGQVHQLHPDGRHEIAATSTPVSALAETGGGQLLAATPAGLRLVGASSSWALVAALPAAAPDLRMNDGKADAAGRFVGGTMTIGDPRPGAGSLWSFDRGGPRELVTSLTISNGLTWTADGATLYLIDTPTRRVDAFDYDMATGSVADRRPVITLPEGAGDPDGMCIDDDGGLWVALWGGGAVHRYIDGRLDAVIDLPTPYVTCPAFTGPARDRLVITTASEPFGATAPPGAGDVYVAQPGIIGPAPHLVDLDRITDRADP